MNITNYSPFYFESENKENDQNLENLSSPFCSSLIDQTATKAHQICTDQLETVMEESRQEGLFSNSIEIEPIKDKKRKLSCLEEELVEESIDWQSFIAEGHSIFDCALEEQANFFTSLEPPQWFSLFRDEKERIKCNIPANSNHIQRLIYVFKNKEKNCLLIGKTGGSLKHRLQGYLNVFNRQGSENWVKNANGKEFLVDVKTHPEQFEVGILYALHPQDDLNLCETLFIDYKGTVGPLYNYLRGGGGGLAHSEEKSKIFAVPKPETAPYTPEKYYSYKKNQKGKIHPVLTPTFKRKAQNPHMSAFAYAIKKVDDIEQYYIGVSADPERRSKEHGYGANYCNPEGHTYHPQRASGSLHKAMASSPEKFKIGLLPVCTKEEIKEEDQDKFLYFKGIAQLEKYSIAVKQAFTQGFNCNRGGGGPIADPNKKLLARRLVFDK